ncbi:MAG: AMP-binding protein [Gammaproteobacteria bacterium]|nr:AMP-binding protein [Gammaproteobacteria bacterium]
MKQEAAGVPDPRIEQTLPQVLAKRVAELGDKPWIVCGDKSYSYRAVDDQSGRLATGLAGRGINSGNTVLLLLPDDIEIIHCWCALAKLGAIEVPVNTHLRGTVLNHVIDDSRARACITESRYLDRLLEREEYPYLEALIVAGELSAVQRVAVERRFECIALEACFDDEPLAPGDNAPRFNDVGAVMYTSGTTGPSKGVMVTHAHSYEYALAVAENLDLNSSDIYYNPLPLFHIAGQWAAVYASCIRGATVVLAQGFSAKRFWNDVRQHGATTTFLLGAMANWLAQLEPQDDDRNNPMERMLVVPLLPDTEAFKQRFDVLVCAIWGSTEVNCPTRSGFDLVDSKTCGYICHDRYEVRIVDDNDMEVPPGVPGEAVVRAKEPWITMAGYWNNPEATVKAWRNQWVHSGDMLMRDENDNLYFVDRVKDAIRRSGENISSMEVENEINAHEPVLECAVVPVDSEHTEQEVKAYIVLKEGAGAFDHEAFIRFLEPRMAYFMIPRFVEIVDALPKTQTGKIQKFELRGRPNSKDTWDRVSAGVKLSKT